MRTAGLRDVVGVLDFRRLLRVRLVGQLGDGLFQTALFAAVFFNPERATSAGQAASAFAVLLLPFSVVGPFAGVFLDRWRRQRVLRNAGLVRAALVVVFASLLVAQGPTAPLVQAVALLVVSCNRFVLSGLSAALPHVVEERRLVVANALSPTLGGGAYLVGGVLAVGLRSVWGEDDLGAARTALVAALAYALAGLLASRLAPDLLGPTHVDSRGVLEAMAGVARGVAQGAAHVRERGPALRGLAAISAHRFFYGLSTVATLLLYTDDGYLGRQRDDGFGGLAMVAVAAAAGGLVGALVTPSVTSRIGTQRWVTLVFAVAAVVEVVFGLPYTHGAFLVAAVFLGLAAQAAKICVDTLVQESVDDDFRGRVFSFYDTAFNLSFVSAAALSAVLLPDDGRSYAVIGVVAGGYALTSLVYGVATARRLATEPPEPVIGR